MEYSNLVKKIKTGSVVTLEQAKNHVNVDDDFTEDDQKLSLIINQATSYCEDFTGIDIIVTECEQEFVNFCSSEHKFSESPFREIVSIKGYDEDDNETIITSSDYSIHTRRTEFVVMFKETLTYNRLVFSFNTGYDDENIPMTIHAAILIKLNDLYDMERTSFTVGVNYKDNQAVKRLLAGHTINRW